MEDGEARVITYEDLEAMIELLPAKYHRPLHWCCNHQCNRFIGENVQYWYGGLWYCSPECQLVGKEEHDRWMEILEQKRDRR